MGENRELSLPVHGHPSSLHTKKARRAQMGCTDRVLVELAYGARAT